MVSPNDNPNNGDGKIDWVKSREVFEEWVEEMEAEERLEHHALAVVNEVFKSVSPLQYCRVL
jgi:hypothetical protein